MGRRGLSDLAPVRALAHFVTLPWTSPTAARLDVHVPSLLIALAAPFWKTTGSRLFVMHSVFLCLTEV